LYNVLYFYNLLKKEVDPLIREPPTESGYKRIKCYD